MIGCLTFVLFWCVRKESDAQGVKAFGVPEGKLPLSGFGDPTSEELLRKRYPRSAVAVNGMDFKYAVRQLATADDNNDGTVTMLEWIGNELSEDLFHEMDLDGDGVVTTYENTLRWAMTRLKRDDVKRSVHERKERRSLAAVREQPVIAFDPDERIAALRKQNQQLANYLVDRYDADGNDVIDRREFTSTRTPYGRLSEADFNHDGRADAGEVAKWLMLQIESKHKSDEGLPIELRQRDTDNDGQLTLAEYAPQPTSELVAEFADIDRNDDGLLTPIEFAQGRAGHQPEVRVYEQLRAGVLLPDAVLISEIQVVDDLVIGNIDVKVELSKDDDSFVDLFLIGPERQTIPLFKGAWSPWRGHVLDGTVFSDQADKLRPPIGERPTQPKLRPPGVEDEATESLAVFKGHGAKGRWRLVTRNHNDRSGLLRRWTLLITPEQAETSQ